MDIFKGAVLRLFRRNVVVAGGIRMETINVFAGLMTSIVLWGFLVRILFVMPYSRNFEWVKSWVLVFGTLLYVFTLGLIVYYVWWVFWILGVFILIIFAKRNGSGKGNSRRHSANEQSSEDDRILERRKITFSEKINIVNDYLANDFELEVRIEDKKEKIDQYIVKYHSLTSTERGRNLKNPDIFFTTPQMIELKRRLDLSREDYVPSANHYVASETSTIEYLISQTDIFKRLGGLLNKQKIRMTINTSVPNWTFDFNYYIC